MNIKEYWRNLRDLASQLDPEAAELDAKEHEPAMRTHLQRSQKEIWLISIVNEEKGSHPGVVVSAHPMVAAQYIKDKTHELATKEQVAAWQATLDARRVEIAAQVQAAKGPVPQIVISPEIVAAAAAKQPAGKARAAE